MDGLYETNIQRKLRQTHKETAEIQLILKKLEEMEQMDDSEELETEIMNTVSQYPELMSAMKSYNEDHSFEKEKVEYERLKLEEQISMLEKVIEEGIKQTTELQEIHHSEVEDLHKQIINLQKQVANHVRFIDDHCVDSEEIRGDMQKDIDRLVAQLEDQDRQSRTSKSLETQVQRLEGEMAELASKLSVAAEGERRAKEQLDARKDEKQTEVTDLQNEVSWFRGEYDQLLKKVFVFSAAFFSPDK
jgi:DNA repair exonuclease SbcCD ATPase subunit